MWFKVVQNSAMPCANPSPLNPSPKGRGEKISPDIMVIPGGEKHPVFPDSLSLLPEGEGQR